MLDKFFAEILGTFIFLGVIITSGHSTTRANDALIWIKIGLTLSVAILLLGYISGGHFNPAVSFMFYINNELPLHELIVYIIAQLIGATLAFFYFLYIKNNIKNAVKI
jgi:aquaporin Z